MNPSNLKSLAARAASCKVEEIMKCYFQPDGSLVVIVWPGAKHIFQPSEYELRVPEGAKLPDPEIKRPTQESKLPTLENKLPKTHKAKS